MKRTCRLLLSFLIVATTLVVGQQQAPPIETSQLSLPIYSVNIAPATQANTSIVGNPGTTTIYYWMVSNFLLGQSSPQGPFIVNTAPTTLSSGNYVIFTPVYPGGGLLSIDLLKTSTPVMPIGACACAVATGLTSGSVNDQSNSTSSYTVNPAKPSIYDLFLQNEVQGSGVTQLILRQGPSGTFINNLSTGTSSGGTVTSVASGTGLTGGPITTTGTISLSTPVSVANGGTGSTGPSLIAGTNITITGSWPNQTINSSGSGSGTVTSFSAGNLSPLFTTSVATSTSTPALTFTLSNAPAYSVYGNSTGTSGGPGFTATPTLTALTINGCAGGTYTKADGTGCGTPSGAGTVTSVATGTGLTGGPITGTGTISISTVPTANGGTNQASTVWADVRNCTSPAPTAGGDIAACINSLWATSRNVDASNPGAWLSGNALYMNSNPLASAPGAGYKLRLPCRVIYYSVTWTTGGGPDDIEPCAPGAAEAGTALVMCSDSTGVTGCGPNAFPSFELTALNEYPVGEPNAPQLTSYSSGPSWGTHFFKSGSVASTGTATFAASTTVTGSGVTWTSAMIGGYIFDCDSGTAPGACSATGRIVAVPTSTSLTLDSAWTGNVNSAHSYTIVEPNVWVGFAEGLTPGSLNNIIFGHRLGPVWFDNAGILNAVAYYNMGACEERCDVDGIVVVHNKSTQPNVETNQSYACGVWDRSFRFANGAGHWSAAKPLQCSTQNAGGTSSYGWLLEGYSLPQAVFTEGPQVFNVGTVAGFTGHLIQKALSIDGYNGGNVIEAPHVEYANGDAIQIGITNAVNGIHLEGATVANTINADVIHILTATNGTNSANIIDNISSFQSSKPLIVDDSHTSTNVTGLYSAHWEQAGSFASLGGALDVFGQITATEPTGSVWGSATGGAKGAGTINAAGLYVNGVAVSGGVTNPMTTLGDDTYGGASGVFTRLAGPTAPGVYVKTEIPSSGAATAETYSLAGVKPNPQTGTTYTYLSTDATQDRAAYTSFSNASAIAATLPQSGSTGFGSNWVNKSCNIGAGTVTITPTTSTISYTTGSSYTSGASSMPLTTGQCAWIYSDNTNYFANINGGPTSACPTCVTSAASLTSGAIMTGAGSQASQTNTTGTGVVTALGVNTGSAGAFAVIIATGTSAMGTGAITSGTCATVVTTTATGATTASTIVATPTADPTGVTGYAPSASGSLYIQAYPTSGNVNFKVCNNTSGTLTPSALTLNWEGVLMRSVRFSVFALLSCLLFVRRRAASRLWAVRGQGITATGPAVQQSCLNQNTSASSIACTLSPHASGDIIVRAVAMSGAL